MLASPLWEKGARVPAVWVVREGTWALAVWVVRGAPGRWSCEQFGEHLGAGRVGSSGNTWALAVRFPEFPTRPATRGSALRVSGGFCTPRGRGVLRFAWLVLVLILVLVLKLTKTANFPNLYRFGNLSFIEF